jgi:hypothetical protein
MMLKIHHRDDLISLCQENCIDLIPFDDGHVPLNFTKTTAAPVTETSTSIGESSLIARRRPVAVAAAAAAVSNANQTSECNCTHGSNSSSTTATTNTTTTTTTPMSSNTNTSSMLHVVEDALPQELADEIYLTTIVSSPESMPSRGTAMDSGGTSTSPQRFFNGAPWGEYVTMKEARERAEDLLQQLRQATTAPNFPLKSTYPCPKLHARTRKEIALDAVAHFFILRIPDALIDTTSLAHGVAVWVLAADVQSEVEYHIDYAELVRYEYNITYPPLYGATVHCSRLWSSSNTTTTNNNRETDRADNPNNTIVGGEFVAFMEGFPHYERHGYKGKKLPVEVEYSSSSTSTNDIRVVPYKFNQGILLHGEIPHSSTPIQSIEPRTIPRVIMGFNVFDTVVGPLVAIAPEHSSAFNRRIKMYQMIASSTNNCSNRFDLNFILNNKPLAKLLVQAKREKMKRQFQQDQQLLHDCIQQLYEEHKKVVKRTTSSEDTPDLDSLADFDDLVTKHIFDYISHRMENKKFETADILYAINKFRTERESFIFIKRNLV